MSRRNAYGELGVDDERVGLSYKDTHVSLLIFPQHQHRRVVASDSDRPTLSVMAQHCMEPVLHWAESSRASSALGAAAATTTNAATGRRVATF
jgi:hypothetical protein